MRKIIPIFLLFFASCSHVSLKYKAEFDSKGQGNGIVITESSYPIRWLAISCGATFWFYGGACWLYNLYPTDVMTEEVRSKAQVALTNRVPDFKILHEDLEANQWKFTFDQTQVYVGQDYVDFMGQDKQKLNSKDTKSQLVKSFDPEAFEQQIVSKPQKEDFLFSDKEGFPPGWPEKWFFETPKFKYWTIVGEKNTNQSNAMFASAIKANEIIIKEFPLTAYKSIPKFETTHSEIQKTKGQFQSWRIIRVSQEDIVKLTK